VNLDLRKIVAKPPSNQRESSFRLKDISLNIQSGEHLAIIGPSGSGKTTLLQVLAAALKPISGKLDLDGTNPWSLSVSQLQELRSKLFYAPQIPPLPPRQRVVTTLSSSRLTSMTLGQSLLNLICPQHTKDAMSALDLFDLKEKVWKRVDHLSGGERQRVGLARVLMSSAKLWLVDEPLSALDPKRSKQAISTLIAEANKRGTTLIVTLHQVEVATGKFPRVIGLKDGSLEFDLAAELVTKNLLHELYADHEGELNNSTTSRVNIDENLEVAKTSNICRPQ
jgi:phosphonate transport system ATP-binding protein